MEKLTLTVEDARKLLGLSRGLMYHAIRRGEIPSLRVGRRLLIPRAPLLKLLGELNSKPADSRTPPSATANATGD